MMQTTKSYNVWIHSFRAGTLYQRGDYTWFELSRDYLNDPDRPILGMQFEDNPNARVAAALRLPPWFSNLLPEGVLREWIADSRGVSQYREMELLAETGHDLPGAVRVVEGDPTERTPPELVSARVQSAVSPQWKFSLAGVGLKLSMLAIGERFTAPGVGDGGDWIIKLPDPVYPCVPINEYSMMKLAGAVGIQVPEVRLVSRAELDLGPRELRAWPESEEFAYAVRRFDRGVNRSLFHIEDFAQVRNIYPDAKYHGNFETVAAICYRQRDVWSLEQFVRRMIFNLYIGNGDAHFKNWSFLFGDEGKVPQLSPAYDLVCTAPYRPAGDVEDLGLRFDGTRRPTEITFGSFNRLQRRLGADVDVEGIARDASRRTEVALREQTYDEQGLHFVAEWLSRNLALVSSRLRTGSI